MPEAKLDDLGVVEIHPKDSVKKHRLPVNVEPAFAKAFLQEWEKKKEQSDREKAEEYKKALAAYPLEAYSFEDDLAKVILNKIAPASTALIRNKRDFNLVLLTASQTDRNR